ncbi:hypothetical protein ACFL5K_00780, partial [Gemmatimonadota bacterium]
MKKQLRNILFAFALILLVIFVIFVINQTMSVVMLVKEYNLYFGNILLYGLLLIYAAFFVFSITCILKMPSALRPPGNKQSPEFETYIEKLKRNLARNKHVIESDIPLETQSDIEKALVLLNT